MMQLLYSIVYFLNNINYSVFFDAAISGQITFQRPATQIMEQLTDLHHDIFAILLFISVLVFYLLVIVAYKFKATNYQSPRNFYFTAHTKLEIAWTLFPVCVILLILYPSFALLYAMDELSDPMITVKIIGHQ